MKNIGIYIHIPFCVKKCNYCDFLSAPADNTVKELYLRALQGQIASFYEEDYNRSHKVTSIYFGGGTPSLVSAEWIGKLLDTVKKFFVVDDNAEISIECNPGTADEEKLEGYLAAGINRLSIGLQSTNDDILCTLGRVHDFSQFLQVYKTARRVGFDNINIDIMSGLPDQTLEDYSQTLDTVLSLAPEHISAYSLIIEPGTPFEHMELNLPDEDTEREMYYLTKRRLAEFGYERYEISNYAKPLKQCRHNNIYWTGRDYLGFGIGAASLDRGFRYSVVRDINKYMDLAFKEKWSDMFENVEKLTDADKMCEYCILGLRRCEGVSLSRFEVKFGRKLLGVYGDVVMKYAQMGLLRISGDNLRFTDRGIDVSNTVLADFMPD
ncbi:MAG: radical SAM family heme chaperone HemW [Lachnospiraceae bacterium]|nr:radical SAM family heme chaperone HemW [Lachnospiraceae bacterium]